MQTSDYITIGIYLVFLVAVGWFFGRLSHSSSDFVRGGGKATWWLVGSSSLMAGISAFTFTGNAAAAYEAGPTLLVIYLATICAFFIQGAWIAGWLRQTRAYTVADVLRWRFGPSVEQFKSYYGLIFGLFSGAIPLWALAVFCASVFNIPPVPMILILGTVVTLYSIRGGKWAVMGNDFVQSLVLFPITILVAWYCLKEVGGVQGLVDVFSRPDLKADFALIKPEGAFPDGKFTWKWMVVAFLIQLTGQLNLLTATRYLAAADGREASRAAYFCGFGMILGTLIWFTPPLVARALWAPEVQSIDVGQVGGSAYAVAAMQVLPNGLMGIMVSAMLAATLSTMDTTINTNAGIFIRNILPALRRVFGKEELSDQRSLFVGRVATVVLGAFNTGMAVWYSQMEGFGLFDSMLIIGSIIGMPLIIPMLAGLLIKSLPRWGFFSILGVAMIPSLWSLIDEAITGNDWNYVDRSIWVMIFGTVATFASMPFYRSQPAAFRQKVEAFFERMHTPLSEEERGESTDHVQAHMLGMTTLVMGGFILLLLFLPNPLSGRIAILSVAGCVLLVAGLLLLASHRIRLRQRKRDSAAASAMDNALECQGAAEDSHP
ncbi:hypothetical protein H5P28_16765 [Ruficoccus amylovorans]|uniref:Transporter n=1 Tax=Ruficoccus amylovorans TaxID=1804625 RepID=A0A842HHW0_9BACT|nr:hypothetical protein [Ruficoccus amylovorans]MBC2595919.1 hypothetical protein [Ruficoccus amylovorans]